MLKSGFYIISFLVLVISSIVINYILNKKSLTYENNFDEGIQTSKQSCFVLECWIIISLHNHKLVLINVLHIK